jgi:acid phosphatase type 7
MRLIVAFCAVAVLMLVNPVYAQTEPDPVFVGAGDISACGLPGDEQTVGVINRVMEQHPHARVFTAGDNVYPDGTMQQFLDCYEPNWGAYKDRTAPSPGNHDYNTPGAAAYFEYFGVKAGYPGAGFYSFNRGNWHIVSMNSNVDVRRVGHQGVWLIQDLIENPRPCTLVIFHHPLFSPLEGGNSPKMREIWETLYRFGADVVINGDNHMYVRYAPQDPAGNFDPERGIVQFTVGTGGATLARSLGSISTNVEARSNATWGVLKLTLHERSYSWEFLPVEGGTFMDSGRANCVDTRF